MSAGEPPRTTEPADAPLGGAHRLAALAWAALWMALWALARLHRLDGWWR